MIYNDAGTAVALQDAVALLDGLNTFTNVLIHAESHMRKGIAQHLQVYMYRDVKYVIMLLGGWGGGGGGGGDQQVGIFQ